MARWTDALCAKAEGWEEERRNEGECDGAEIWQDHLFSGGVHGRDLSARTK